MPSSNPDPVCHAFLPLAGAGNAMFFGDLRMRDGHSTSAISSTLSSRFSQSFQQLTANGFVLQIP
jgi:hypothetical protein